MVEELDDQRDAILREEREDEQRSLSQPHGQEDRDFDLLTVPASHFAARIPLSLFDSGYQRLTTLIAERAVVGDVQSLASSPNLVCVLLSFCGRRLTGSLSAFAGRCHVIGQGQGEGGEVTVRIWAQRSQARVIASLSYCPPCFSLAHDHRLFGVWITPLTLYPESDPDLDPKAFASSRCCAWITRP